MPAGSVAAPSIIPLRPPVPGQHKSIISSNIKIELWTETKDAKIYYTINGTRPDPFQKFGDKCTKLYRAPFTLPSGKITVKALAVAGNEGERLSPVVTKTFEVQFSPPPEVPPFDDDLEFQQDLNREKSKRQLERAAAELLHASKTAWAERKDLEEAKLRESTRRALEEARLYNDGRHPGMYSHNGPMELPRDPLAPAHYKDLEDDHYLPEDLTTDAILALQNMHINSNNTRNFNFSTTTAGHHASTSEWMPTAYASPTRNARTASAAGATSPYHHPHHYNHHPHHHHHQPHQQYNNHYSGSTNGYDIDIPLSCIPPPAPPAPRKAEQRDLRTVGCQTVGPFFPSQSRIEQLEKELEERRAQDKQMLTQRPPLLTAFSPGKGYWRKQVDHICQHLKAHAQSDAEFRALVGEPKMGKIMSSAIRDGDGEFSITMTFSTKETNSKRGLFSGTGKVGYPTRSTYKGRPPSARQHFYRDDDDDIMSEDSFATRSLTSARSGRKRTVRRPKPKPKKTVSKVSSLDSRLLREVGSDGEGSSSEVQQLIDEGADPDARNKSGVPALHLAATHKHIDCIYVLCDSGADVNVKGPSSRKGNTALHEAVSLGQAGLRTVDALLKCGADQNIKNGRGETAFEMATKAGYEAIAKRFAAALGQSQLRKMIHSH